LHGLAQAVVGAFAVEDVDVDAFGGAGVSVLTCSPPVLTG
jgi:hypothetical protein